MTVLELATRRTGSLRKGLNVAEFILWWHVGLASFGRSDFTMDELAELVGKSRAQMFRDQSAYREAFHLHPSPGDLDLPAIRAWGERMVKAGEDLHAADMAMGVMLEAGAPA
jgi:hypothetical protein